MPKDHDFCDHCPGCRPGIINAKTGEVLGPDSPEMVIVNQVWNTQTTYAERKAYILVTAENSRDPETVALATAVVKKIHNALRNKQAS